MNKKGILLGIIGYFLALLFLFKWQVEKLFQPLPVLSIVLGIIILTLSKWKPGLSRRDILENAMINGLFSGILTTLLSMLSTIAKGTESLSQALLPVLYGGLWYIILKILLGDRYEASSNEKETVVNTSSVKTSEPQLPTNWNTPEFIQPILVEQGLTTRECHVALKIIQGANNKEIAEQLYISEGTVKKHIQNIYKRCEVSDRQAFLVWFWTLSKQQF